MATATTDRPVTATDLQRAKAFGLKNLPPVEPTPAPTPKPEPTAARRCGLTLSIGGTRYKVRPLEGLTADAGVVRGFRLKRTGAEAIVIAETVAGTFCECADYVFRREGHGTHCKHLSAARACGLL